MDVKLVMFKSNGQRKDFPVIDPSTVIGRAENCDLQVPLVSVSRRHCQLRIEGNAFQVKDLGSSNGTYVDNQRVNEAALSRGARIVVGPIVFPLQVDGEPETIRPVKIRGQRMAEQSGGEGVVELEEDIVATPGGSALLEGDTTAGGMGPGSGESKDVAPIATLETLAADSEDEEDSQQS